jgi:Tfp pilus assembly protein PilF
MIALRRLFQCVLLCVFIVPLACSRVPVATSGANQDEMWRQVKSGYAFFKKGDLDSAMSSADEALRLDNKQNPDATAKAYVLRSLVFNVKKKHDLAVTEATKAIQAKADASYAYFARARAYE